MILQKHILFKKLSFLHLLLFFLLLLSCSPKKTPEEEYYKSKVGLSKNAELIYAYLVLEEAVKDNNLQLIHNASEVFIKYDPKAQPLIDIAAWYLVSDYHDDALALIKQLIVINPNDFNVSLLLAEFYLEQGNNQEAISVIEKYTANNPNDINALLDLALLYIKLEYYDEANQIFEAFTPQQMTPVILYYYAQSLEGLGFLEEAKTKLKEALEEKEDFIEAIFELATIEEEIGNTHEAITYYSKLLEADETNLNIIGRLIYLNILQNDIAKACELAEKTQEPLLLLLNAIPVLLEKGDFFEARKLAEYLRSKNVEYDELFFYEAAIAFEDESNIPKALDYLYQVSEDSDSYYRALNLIIELEIILKKYPEALSHLEKGLSIYNEDKNLFTTALQLLFLLKRNEEAFDFAEKYAKLSLEKEILTDFDAEVLYHYAGLLLMNNRGEESVPYLKTALKVVPDHYEAMNSLAYHYAVENINLKEALALIEVALDASPEKAHFLDTLAWIEYRMGKYDDAHKNILKAIELAEAQGYIDSAIYEHYGFIALQLSYTYTAKTAFEKALESFPDNSEEIRIILEELK